MHKIMYFITFLTNIKKNSFYTKYRQYKFSKLVKVAKFSINRCLHLYFSLKLHNIQNEHFSVFTHIVSVKIHIVLKYYIFTSNFTRIKRYVHFVN
jgi:hypothetical protein